MTALVYKKNHPREVVHTPFIYPAYPPEFERIIVEIGPGRGDFLFHLAESNLTAMVYGIEIKRKRVDKLIRRTEKRKLNNIVLIQDDARRALKQFLKDGSIETIHINFPDPWPKKRHGKNRLFNEEFVQTCAEKINTKGLLYFTTDFEKYACEAAEIINTCPLFQSLYPELIRTKSPDAYPTFFAQKWEAEGRRIYYQKYQKLGDRS